MVPVGAAAVRTVLPVMRDTRPAIASRCRQAYPLLHSAVFRVVFRGAALPIVLQGHGVGAVPGRAIIGALYTRTACPLTSLPNKCTRLVAAGWTTTAGLHATLYRLFRSKAPWRSPKKKVCGGWVGATIREKCILLRKEKKCYEMDQ